jgi:hypothetical protein
VAVLEMMLMTEETESEERLREIPASEILDKIQKGEPVEYDHVRIVGDLELSKLDLPTQHIERTNFHEEAKHIQSRIKITNSRIEGETLFISANFLEPVELSGTTFSEDADFRDSTFSEDADFKKSTFSKDAFFRGSIFSKDAFFRKSTFSEDADFKKSIFSEGADFRDSTFRGEILTFKKAIFLNPSSQEDACRRAKIVLESSGDREESGYHFYREMEGKRRQKDWYVRYPEFIFIQLIFGYGVHPFRLWAFWLGFVGVFALIYWLGHGIDATASSMKEAPQIVDYIWFSIATAITPGYAGYKPTPDFKLVAGLEAIFGTFMWAAFIATFSRNYMRW